MILDRLENADKYLALHAGFAQAFTFLRRCDLAELAAGRHEIDGDRVYAMVVKGPGRGTSGAKREAHRNYIDIQFTCHGADVIGWKPLSGCAGAGEGYMPEKDTELYAVEPDAWIPVAGGNFAIFFPEDVHAPMGAQGDLHKVVVKVAV